MATSTSTYSFTLPAVGGDANSWGGYLNANWELVEDILDGSHASLKVDIDNYTVDGITLTNNNPGSNPTTITCETITFQGGVAEQVYTGLGTSGTLAIDPANGTIQTIAMTGNVTISSSLASGEFATLRITSVGTDTVTWPSMQWVGGSAPTLDASNTNWIHLWNVSGTLYGSFIGASS